MRLFFALLLLPMIAFGRDTAYQALRTLQNERGRELLNRVVEVKGFGGIPQPETWVIVVDDPLARGGVREVEITDGKISSERTPVKGYSGISTDSIMNFEKLNLDSKGAFTLAEQEAKIARVSFDAVDYVLQRDADRGVPVWTLQLLNPDLQRVGTLTIAADNGAVLSRSFEPESAALRGHKAMKQGAEKAKEEGEHLGRKIDRTMRRVGGSVEEFFTGHRTFDRKYRDEE